LIERGHKDVLDYDYEFFTAMLESSSHLRDVEYKNQAFLIRLGFSSEDIEKVLGGNGRNNSTNIKQNVSELIDLQKQLK
jgi:hypothetical protein